MKCDCWIGILNAYDQSDINSLRLSNFKNELIEKSEMSKRISEFNLRSFEPIDYIDRRRGMSTLFEYCPLCGSKIKWGDIRKILETP